MTKEDKELLLKDLSARLPYGVKIYLDDFPNATLVGVVNEGIILHCDKHDYTYDTPWNIGYVKPYLLPISSMTEEQKREYIELLQIGPATGIDWLNTNHFDYHGLIPMGLAKDATGKNIY